MWKVHLPPPYRCCLLTCTETFQTPPCCCYQGKCDAAATELSQGQKSPKGTAVSAIAPWKGKLGLANSITQNKGREKINIAWAARPYVFPWVTVRLIHTGAAEQKHMVLVPAWDYTWANKPRWSELALSTLVLEAQCRQMEVGSGKSQYGSGVY